MDGVGVGFEYCVLLCCVVLCCYQRAFSELRGSRYIYTMKIYFQYVSMSS